MTQSDQPIVPIQETVAYRIYRSSRLVRHLHFLTFQRSGFDLTPEQWFILNKLALRSPQSQTELGESIMDDRPNMTRILLTLEKKGWVARRTDEKDRRKTEVQLTDAGREVLAECLPSAIQVRDQLRSGVSDEELQQFWQVLDKLDLNMEGIIMNRTDLEEPQ
ncbi:MAG: hypothetical protein K0R57_2337 [Paenibacillaceae bacterium]|nr:hypothetical protein [Paenibacillaceae bacterium]